MLEHPLITAFNKWPAEPKDDDRSKVLFGSEENGYGIEIGTEDNQDYWIQNIVIDGKNQQPVPWLKIATMDDMHWLYIARLVEQVEKDFHFDYLKMEDDLKTPDILTLTNWEKAHNLEFKYGSLYFRIKDKIDLWKKLYLSEGKNAQERTKEEAEHFLKHDELLLLLKNIWITFRHLEETAEKTMKFYTANQH